MNGNFQQMYNALFDNNWRVKSYRKAFPLLTFAANDGYAHAQNLVGYAFDLGLAPRRDTKKALYWYRKAAKGGSVDALYNLALHYVHGDGIPTDPRKAFALYERAARKGHVLSCCNLGTMYAEGEGIKTNPALAVKWWRKAARKGDAMAQYNLGSAYVNGEGVRPNKRFGTVWLKKAAKKGHKKAARELISLRTALASR